MIAKPAPKTCFTTFACPAWHLDRIIDAAVLHGYQGVEVRVDAGHSHGIEVAAPGRDRMEFHHLFSAAGVEPCCMATGIQFVSDHAVEYAKARIELAADIGCRAIRVFGAPRDCDLPMQDAIEKTAWHLHQAAELAQHAGVELWLETDGLFSKAADTATAVRIADHPAVGINYDNMNPYRTGEPLEKTFEALRGLVRHAHFHDAIKCPDNVVVKPIGQGDLPIQKMFQGLLDLGFDGYFCGEWFNNQYGENPHESIEAYHNDIVTLTQSHNHTAGD